MKIRLRRDITGTFHGIDGGLKRGDVVEVDDANGARYCKLGYAEPVVEKHVETAVVEPVIEVRAETANVAEAVAKAATEAAAEAPKKAAPAKAAPKA